MKEYEWAPLRDGWVGLSYDYRKKAAPRGKYMYRQNNVTYFQAVANAETSDFDSAQDAINWILNKYDDAE